MGKVGLEPENRDSWQVLRWVETRPARRFAPVRNANSYFWRTYRQQELDFVGERGGQLSPAMG